MATFRERRMATAQRAKDKALLMGGRILTPTWDKNDDLIEVECSEGHHWNTTAYRVNVGDWCPVCFHHLLGAKKRERSLGRFRDYVAARGGRLFDGCPSANGRGWEVECRVGHRFAVAPVDAVYNQTWCPECRAVAQDSRRHQKRLIELEGAKRAKVDRSARSDSQLRDAAAKSGLQVLEVLQGAEHPRIRLFCNQHQGEVFLRDDQVRAGHRCKFCRQREATQAKRNRRLEEARHEAILRGGTLISESYTVAGQKLEWRCQLGHRWLAPAASVLRTGGTWCPKCSRSCAAALRTPKAAATRRGRLLAVARSIAEGRGGRCLDEVYRSSAEGLRFQCSRGHDFKLSFRKLRYQWCEQCSGTRHSRGEMVTRGILEQLLGISLPPGRPEWLVSDKGRGLSLDGYSDLDRIAFEYQGEGVHGGTRTTGRYRDQKKLLRTKELDRQKIDLCREAGVRLLVIDGFEARMSRNAILHRVKTALDVAGVSHDRTREIAWERVVVTHDTLGDRLEARLSAAGLRLVSGPIANVFTTIQLQCLRHGLQWDTTPSAVLHRNRLCPECSGGRTRHGQRTIAPDSEQGRS